MITATNGLLQVGAIVTSIATTDLLGQWHPNVTMRVVREATEQEYHDYVREVSPLSEEELRELWKRDGPSRTHYYKVEMD